MLGESEKVFPNRDRLIAGLAHGVAIPIQLISLEAPRPRSRQILNCAAGSQLLENLFHEFCRLDAEALRDLDKFKYVYASLTRFNFPDKRVAPSELGGQLTLG